MLLLQLVGALVLFLHDAGTQANENQIGCTVTNVACESGFFLGEFSAASLDECRQSCLEAANCNFYTYHSTELKCLEYYECYEVSSSLCPDVCQSGSVQCNCFMPGECQGVQTGISFPPNLGACLELCQNSSDCSWWNYDPEDSLCLLLSSCAAVEDQLCPQCLTGEKGCYEQEVENADVLLVTSGVNAAGLSEDSVEIIALQSPYMSCPEVPDFPYSGWYGKGFVHEHEPVICGFFNHKQCYRFNTESWQWYEYVETNEFRFGGAGAILNEDVYVLLGGPASPNTTESFNASNEAFSTGLDIPYEVWEQCATGFIGQLVIMTGGQNPSYYTMNRTAILDLNNGSWSYLPDFSGARLLHGCGIATSADGTSSLVIAGGYDSGPSPISDSEILDLGPFSSSWRKGADLPSGSIREAYSLPYKNSFLLVGGLISCDAVPSAAIWQYDPNNSSMPWILRPEELQVARYKGPTSILLKAQHMNCVLEA